MKTLNYKKEKTNFQNIKEGIQKKFQQERIKSFSSNLSQRIMTSKNGLSIFNKKSTKRINSPTSEQIYVKQQQNMPKYAQKPSSFIPQGEKINFESQDSQGSDISYQSSIESQEDINISEIEYFKQQMGRFFINYPQLINDKILDTGDDFEDGEYYGNENGELNKFFATQGQSGLNKNWNILADQILSQAKQSSSFLESLSRRIALYRSKTHQQDLIDLLLKQEKNIMKDIDLQINLKKKQIKGNKNSLIDHTEAVDNVYFSWRKKKQLENKLNLQKDYPSENHTKNYTNSQQQQTIKRNNRTVSANKRNAVSLSKFHTKPSDKTQQNFNNKQRQHAGTFFLTSNQNTKNNDNLTKTQKSPLGQFSKTFHNSRQRADSKSMTSYQPTDNLNSNKRSYSLNKGLKQNSVDRQKPSNEEGQKQNKTNQFSSNNQNQAFWKHLVNFQPKTQAGRQLCEIIRRTNTPNDQLGIKKTILQFLSRNKQMVQNQMILKSTISQKIQKLYTDDSKQLLMFYPTKMATPQGRSNLNANKQEINGNYSNDKHNGILNGEDTEAKSQNYPGMSSDNGPDMSHKLFDEGEKFMNLLEDIVQGPLMKYWMMLQQKKL